MTTTDLLTLLGACTERRAAYAHFKTPGRAYNSMLRRVVAGDPDAALDLDWVLSYAFNDTDNPQLILCHRTVCDTCSQQHRIPAITAAQMLPWEMVKTLLTREML